MNTCTASSFLMLWTMLTICTQRRALEDNTSVKLISSTFFVGFVDADFYGVLLLFLFVLHV